jgi:hypothetical protein
MANITVTLFWDMDLRKWTTTLAGTTETAPQTGIVQGDIVKFAVRFVQGGAAVVLAAPVFTASSIKAQNDFTGSYLIQLSAPVLSDTTLYTFTVSPLNSANLNTFLQTYRNTWCALEIYDSANGILTTPLELQITPGYSLSGTPTDNAPGVISVAAGKTVTFPQSLTFPSALGTNTYQLSTDGAGTLTWTASGALTDGDKGDITVSNSGATWTIDNDVVGLAQLAHMATARVVGRTTAGTGSPELLTISGTGSVAMTTNPQFTQATFQRADTQDVIVISPRAGGIGDYLLTLTNAPLTFGQTQTFPDVTGTFAVAATTTTATHALFGTATAGAPAYRAIATADIATALTTPGAIGGTTPGTVATTTTSLKGATSGVVTLAAPATATTATLTFAPSASVTMTPPATSFTAARTDAAQTFTGSSQTVATVNTTNTASNSTGAATANLIVQNTSTQNFAHVSLGFRSCAGAAPTIGYNGIISLDGAGRFNFGGDGGNNNSLNVTNAAGSGASGAGVTLTGGGNITAIGALAITGASTLTGNLTSNGALISTPQALSGTTLGAINITTLTTTLAATGVATATLTATGVANGQIKVIVMTQATGACTVTVTNASWGGVTTAVFDAVGDTLMLQYLNSKWTPISNIGVVLA